MNNISGLIALVGWFCFVFTASSWMNIGFWGTILIIIISVFIIVDKDMDSIIKIFALPIGLLFAVKIAGILFTKYPYIPVLAFVAFIIYVNIVEPPPEDESPPPTERERTASEVYYRVLSRQKYERLQLELDQLENERARLRWADDNSDLYYALTEKIEDLRREIADLEDYLRE
ncbi:MAG: hypothetical protein IKE46_09685 [Selenomonadaceae bacterium]|nr:hypothetical protein [Selenomonadaceae bacterium]